MMVENVFLIGKTFHHEEIIDKLTGDKIRNQLYHDILMQPNLKNFSS